MPKCHENRRDYSTVNLAAKLHAAIFEHHGTSKTYREKSGLDLAQLAIARKDLREAHRYYESLPGSHLAITGNLSLYAAEKNHEALVQFYSQAVERESAEKTRLGAEDYQNNRLWSELNKMDCVTPSGLPALAQ